ncbi:hypothetical protein QBZ16_000413 [Prototheca wickerhamii]|uniref:LisH domain-containing protein n=1 Tax=Prototheca wickerhamii TaxID=3111 RepID=A0AAD9IN52_PROWI|nr:hypothetical protein QBZ16_000413 [Prototheca wickerhamii]
MEGVPGQYSRDHLLSTKQVSQWLLSRNYLLTALELLLEAGDAGREEDVEFLEQLFSDPALFPPEEETARKREERLAVVEYELCIAREDLQALERGEGGAIVGRRASVAARGAKQPLESAGASPRPPPPSSSPRVKSSRQRQVLNDIVLQYLLNQGYRVTAGTLRSEAGSGERIAELEEDLRAAREEVAWRREEGERREAELASRLEERARLLAAVDFERSRVLALEEAVVAAQLRADGIALGGEEEEEENGSAGRGQIAAAEGSTREDTGQTPPSTNDQPPSLPSTKRPPASPRRHAAARAARSALDAAAEALPRLLPHVLINRRVEAVEALLALARDHPRLETRVATTEALLHIIKRPSGEQRAATEVLPALCGMAAAEHAERRVLLAQCVAAAARALPAPALAGTALGLLEHLAADAEPSVRLAASEALRGLLRGDLGAGAGERVAQCLLALALDEESVDVAADAQGGLLPAVLEWARRGDAVGPAVLRQLCPLLVSELVRALQQAPFVSGTPEAFVVDGTAVLRSPSAAIAWRAMALLQMLSSVVPFLHEQAAAAFAAQHAEAEEAQGPQDAPAQEAAPHTYADAIAAWAQDRARPARAQHAGAPRDNLLPEILETLVLTVAATLVDVTRMLAPVPETKGLRQRCAALFQEICAGGDERFARSGVEPLLRAAGLCGRGWMRTVCEVNRTFWVHAGKRDKPLLPFRYLAQPRCRRGASCPRPSGAHVQEAARKLAPCTTPAELAGPWTALPALLAGVLPSAGASAAHDLLLRLAAGGEAAWALQNVHALTHAVRFAAAESAAVRGQALEFVEDCAGAPAAVARVCAAAVAAAVAPTLASEAAVAALVLPPLRRILAEPRPSRSSETVDAPVSAPEAPSPAQQAVVAAGVELLACHGQDPALRAQVLELLGDAARLGGGELAVLRACLRLAPSAPPALTEWLLQRALLLLASVHQRAVPWTSPAALSGAAAAVFSLLYAIDGSRFEAGSRAALHLEAALRALWREADLLTAVQRDVLGAVMRDAGVPGAEWAGSEGGALDRAAAAAAASPQLPSPRGLGLAPAGAADEDEWAAVTGALVTGKVFQDWRWDDA